MQTSILTGEVNFRSQEESIAGCDLAENGPKLSGHICIVSRQKVKMVQQRDWPCKVLVILNLLLLWLLGSSQIENKVSALKVSVSIPELVKLNDPFWLNCSHHRAHLDLMEPKRTAKVDEIYAIKWYKDDEEFYRFLPNAEPKISVYETNGIQLDVSYMLCHTCDR